MFFQLLQILFAELQLIEFVVDPDEMVFPMVPAGGSNDQIILGPGSLFTSVLAAVAVPGIADAINAARARLVFALNLVTQDGETLGMTGLEHLRACRAHGGLLRGGVVVAHQGPLEVPAGLSEVTLGEAEAGGFGWDVVYADIAARDVDWPAHDPLRLGRALAAVASD